MLVWLRFPWILQVAEDVAVEAAIDDVSRSSGSLCVLRVSVLVDCHVGCQREREKTKAQKTGTHRKGRKQTERYTQ